MALSICLSEDTSVSSYLTLKCVYFVEIDRRVWGEGFWWGQIEAQLRETDDIQFRFKRDIDRRRCMDLINELQARTLYPHPASDCTSACKARGTYVRSIDASTVKPIWNNPFWKDHFPISKNVFLLFDSM